MIFDSAPGWARYLAVLVFAGFVVLRFTLLRRRWGRIRADGSAPGSSTPGSRPFGIGQGQPAGWYPDPAGEALLRWWDGDQWTAKTKQSYR